MITNDMQIQGKVNFLDMFAELKSILSLVYAKVSPLLPFKYNYYKDEFMHCAIAKLSYKVPHLN